QILLGVTIFAAVILVFDQMSGRKAPRSAGKAPDAPVVASVPGPNPSPTPSAAPAAPATVPTATAAPRLASPPPPDQPWGKRDPFEIGAKWAPSGSKGPDRFAGYRITGVVCTAQGCKAVVNDRVVRPGDDVDGARVLRITKSGIDLEKGGESRFIPVVQKEFFQ
ncbi:MAG: hypothetical protein ACREJK_10820, partial [Candidatus Methylomirabilales bacterium]